MGHEKVLSAVFCRLQECYAKRQSKAEDYQCDRARGRGVIAGAFSDARTVLFAPAIWQAPHFFRFVWPPPRLAYFASRSPGKHLDRRHSFKRIVLSMLTSTKSLQCLILAACSWSLLLTCRAQVWIQSWCWREGPWGPPLQFLTDA